MEKANERIDADMNKHKKFNTYDKVLVRRPSISDNLIPWEADIFSHIDEDGFYITIGLGHITEDNILPYEGNERLVGTTDEPEEEIKLMEGEWVAYVTGEDNFQKWAVGKFHSLDNPIDGERKFQMKPISEKAGYYWISEQVVRFSDFNPNDMEETRKHILCVKNGRVVRFKE